MSERIELNNATFSKAILDRTAFFQIAERGAMGEAGGILILTTDGTVYHANYHFGDLRWETATEAFPVIEKCHFGMFGIGSKVPDDWKYVNLGMGNHLIVRQDYYERFAPLIAGYNNPGEIYQHWLEKAQSIIFTSSIQ